MPGRLKDMSRVAVTIIPPIPATGPGRGGGPLEGDLELLAGFRAEIEDPDLGCDLSLTIGAYHRRLAIERAVFSLREGGPPLTGTRLRSAPLDAYLQAVRRALDELEDRLLVRNQMRSPGAHVPYLTRPNEQDWERFDSERHRNHRTRQLLPLVADAYRQALASPDPKVYRSPTAQVGRRLHKSRGHAARLVAMAREAGFLGPAFRGRSGEDVATEGIFE
ncbi:MAG: hypothetical protein WAO09_07595 [Candidatus Dormiibacterota bacterium]|jgi:hypothetical protein